MELEQALKEMNQVTNTRDILEILGITFNCNYDSYKYYRKKLNSMHKWDYFISDLDGTFFRWVLQKEAFTLFVKFVKKQNYLDFDLEDYYNFLNDIKFFNELEKKAYNKEIEFFEYLNAWIYLLLKHKKLVNWEEYLSFLKYSFTLKEQVKPFKFSLNKLKKVLESGWNFVLVSWAPSFIFDIYLDLLKSYVSKNLGTSYANNIFWFWSYLDIENNSYSPLWWRDHKKWFIDLMKSKDIISNVLWWMGDTNSDFWISYSCIWKDFYFVNPEKKVIDHFDEYKKEGINYNIIIERKDLIFKLDKESIKPV